MIVRLYGDNHKLKRADCRPYRRTNHALAYFSMIPSVDLASYRVSPAKDLGI